MPRFAIIGDIHEETGRLQAVLAHMQHVDDLAGVLLVGDIAEAGMERFATEHHTARWHEQIDATLELIRTTVDVPLAWVPGNHDMRGYEGEPNNADGRVIVIAGVRIHGIGGAGPARFGFRYEWDEDDIRALPDPLTNPAGPPPDILLCHAPPFDSGLDINHAGSKCGSVALRELAERHRGVLLCGHIHESGGVSRIGQCIGYNPGALQPGAFGARLARAQYGLLDFDPAAGHVRITHRDLDAHAETVDDFDIGSRSA